MSIERRFKLQNFRPDAFVDPAREEQMHSLLDGRARWPDGTLRNGKAEALDREMKAGQGACEVLEALGLDRFRSRT